MGCDPRFKYRENYIAFIMKFFDQRFAQGLIADGVEAAQRNEFEYACIQFRAAMVIDPSSIDAVYCYGRACKDVYENGEEEDLIARFKAESIRGFRGSDSPQARFCRKLLFFRLRIHKSRPLCKS